MPQNVQNKLQALYNEMFATINEYQVSYLEMLE